MITAIGMIVITSALAAKGTIKSLEGTAGAAEYYLNEYEVIKSSVKYFGVSYEITSSYDMKTFYEGDAEIDRFMNLAFEGFSEFDPDDQESFKCLCVEAIYNWIIDGTDILEKYISTLNLGEKDITELRKEYKKVDKTKFFNMAIVMESCRV
mgnify:CR=1 FL=1|tara:strand:+ start:527 stop:982 length:456 start_codon:yes stop_codon:yes gene_type:complete